MDESIQPPCNTRKRPLFYSHTTRCLQLYNTGQVRQRKTPAHAGTAFTRIAALEGHANEKTLLQTWLEGARLRWRSSVLEYRRTRRIVSILWQQSTLAHSLFRSDGETLSAYHFDTSVRGVFFFTRLKRQKDERARVREREVRIA